MQSRLGGLDSLHQVRERVQALDPSGQGSRKVAPASHLSREHAMKGSRWVLQAVALSAISSAVLLQSPAQAADPARLQVAPGAPAASAAGAADPVTADSIHDVRAAVRIISQAALQRDFSSNGQIRALLQSAHTMLVASEPALCCDALARVVQLDFDIERIVARVDNVAHAWQTRDGVTIAPPNRDELNVLAREGQSLLRNPLAKAWSGSDESFAAARNAATLSRDDVEPYPAAAQRHVWPGAPSNPQAMTLLSLNF